MSASVQPSNAQKGLLVESGAEAVESAVKIARAATSAWIRSKWQSPLCS